MKYGVFAVITLFFSLVLTLVILELAFWWRLHEQWPRKPFYVMPDATIVDYRGRRLPPFLNWTHISPISGREVTLRTNAQGFRGRKIIINKPRGITRILLLGDSITLSSFLPEQEIFAVLVEKMLSARHEVEVINTAVNDIGLMDEIDILKKSGLQLKPDLVVLGFYMNDSRPPWGFQDEFFTLPPRLVMISSTLETYSYFFKWLWRRVLVTRYKSNRHISRTDFGWDWQHGGWRTDPEAYRNLIKAADLDFGAGWDEKSWKGIYSGMDELRGLAEKNNFKLLVVIFPVAIQVQSQFGDDYPQRKMKEYCRKYEIPCLDLLPVLKEHKDQEVFIDLCHYTPLGNQVIAPPIAAFLETAISDNESQK